MNFIYIILYNFPVFVAKKFNVSYFSIQLSDFLTFLKFFLLQIYNQHTNQW